MSEVLSKEEQKNIEKTDSEIDMVSGEVAEKVGEETAEVVKKVVVEAIRSEFSGPIPPPNIIKGYEEILPGSADRIISMAERQMEHRQSMEKKMIYSESRDSLLGVLFAFFLGLGCIVAAIIMVVLVPQNGGAISGALLGVTGIGSITRGFISSAKGDYVNKKQNQTSQKQRKNKDNTEEID